MKSGAHLKSKLILVLFAFLLLFQSCLLYPKLPFPIGKPKGIYHTVKINQTFWRICQTYNVNPQEVAELNNIKKTSQIKAGDKIFIPGANKVLYVRPTVIAKDQSIKKKPHRKIFRETGMFTWPLDGKVIKKYGVYNGIKHDGLNIKARSGTLIKASSSGKVVFSAYLDGYGNTVIIQHKKNYATVYANNMVNLVKKGNWVSKRQKIAQVGTSGKKSKIAYLHFQIRRYNQPRNPLFYLP